MRSARIDDEVVLRGVVAPPPLADSVVASPVAGRISKLLVQEGDVVAANQLIAQIEDPSLGASATETDALVEAAQVELRSAATERARTESLLAKGIIAQKDLADAATREEAARANLRAAQARSKLARRQLARTDLRASRAGTVLRVFKRAGELLDAADTSVAEIADLSVLELRAQVTGAELVGVDLGASATVELDAVQGTRFAGEVVAVSPAIDPMTSLGTVRVRLTLADARKPSVGLAGAATIRRASRDALLVPLGAIRRSIDGKDEVLACAGDHLEVRPVVVGARQPETAEIQSGLTADARVVVDHVLGLDDGAPIDQGGVP